MNIAQALKEKNKKAAHLKKLVERFNTNNVGEDGVEKNYSSKATLDEINGAVSALVNLKTAIHKASAPVRDKIFKLSELKGLSQQIAYTPTQASVIRNRTTGDIIQKNTPEIDTKAHETILKGYSDEIDKIQEELDAFNHTTSV